MHFYMCHFRISLLYLRVAHRDQELPYPPPCQKIKNQVQNTRCQKSAQPISIHISDLSDLDSTLFDECSFTQYPALLIY